MKIVFDLDYTLLDTVKFKEALVEATGVDPAKYEQAYAKAVELGKGRFDPSILFDALVESNALAKEEAGEVRGRFNDVVKTTDTYLYPEAKELLEALRTHDVAVDLLTFGNKAWQEDKVKHSGLVELFGAVHCTDKDKREVVRDLAIGQDKVIIVNDNGKEMEEMMQVAPEYEYVLKKGPKPVSPELRLPTAETIDDLAVILEEKTGWELRREMREIREARESREESETDAAEKRDERRNIEPPESYQPGPRR